MTQAPQKTALEQIGDRPPAEQLPQLGEFLTRARSATAEAIAMRDAAMRALVVKGWTHRQIAEAAGLSIATVRIVLR